jgi:hypothetical protein
MMKKTPGVAIAIDNCCAIEIIDDKYRIISSKQDANAYKVYWRKNKFHEILIPKKKDLQPLEDIIKK